MKLFIYATRGGPHRLQAMPEGPAYFMCRVCEKTSSHVQTFRQLSCEEG